MTVMVTATTTEDAHEAGAVDATRDVILSTMDGLACAARDANACAVETCVCPSAVVTPRKGHTGAVAHHWSSQQRQQQQTPEGTGTHVETSLDDADGVCLRRCCCCCYDCCAYWQETMALVMERVVARDGSYEDVSAC